MLKNLLFIIIFSLILLGVKGQSSSLLAHNDAIAKQAVIETFTLSEAYPNPASSETKFDYKLPKEAKEVKIIIRSLLGFITSEHLIEGYLGTATIQTNDLTGGIYFYSLMIDGDIKITRKLIVKH